MCCSRVGNYGILVPFCTISHPPNGDTKLFLCSLHSLAATNEGAEEPGPLAKLPKLSPDVVWEWEGDGGRWNQYTPEHAQSLTSALQRGDKETTLQVTPSVKMNVRFSNMTQMNVTTGWQRSVRCLHKGAVSRGMWEFQELVSIALNICQWVVMSHCIIKQNDEPDLYACTCFCLMFGGRENFSVGWFA